MMKLSHALRLEKNTRAVAFVGGGGKTSGVFLAARELAPAIVTTTTHLAIRQAENADRHVSLQPGQPLPEQELLQPGVTLVSGPPLADIQRVAGLTEEQLLTLHHFTQEHHLPLLLEADGSRQRPLKAPADHEPAIPPFADTVVVTIGLHGLGRPLAEAAVHRPEIFARLSGLAADTPVTREGLIKVLLHPQGGLKNIPPGARKIALLNQADTPELQSSAGRMQKALLAAYDSVLVASLQRGEVLAGYETIAAIVLAAGGSSRFGQPKQLLDFHGQPFVRVVAENALRAGLSPVIVLVGAQAGEIKTALQGLPVVIVENQNWQSGQASSIVAGVRSLPAPTGAALFLLADQPQVPARLMRALADRHAEDLPAVLAPYVIDRRANPVLFDRVTFADLLTLTGDTGGRAVFGKFSPRYLPWHDDLLMLDVDTPQDYQRLLDETRHEP